MSLLSRWQERWQGSSRELAKKTFFVIQPHHFGKISASSLHVVPLPCHAWNIKVVKPEENAKMKTSTLPLILTKHLEMDGWEMILSFWGRPIFRGYVSFREEKPFAGAYAGSLPWMLASSYATWTRSNHTQSQRSVPTHAGFLQKLIGCVIEFYCETLSFWVILVNIWWFWVIFRLLYLVMCDALCIQPQPLSRVHDEILTSQPALKPRWTWCPLRSHDCNLGNQLRSDGWIPGPQNKGQQQRHLQKWMLWNTS